MRRKKFSVAIHEEGPGMEHVSHQPEPVEATDSPPLLLSLGNAAELTTGEGGSGSESKRYEYN